MTLRRHVLALLALAALAASPVLAREQPYLTAQDLDLVAILPPPVTMTPDVAKRFAGGLNDYHGTPLHVSRGIGMERQLAPQVRFLCPPEICLLEISY